MQSKNMNPLRSKGWVKKLAVFLGVASISTMMALPILAQFRGRPISIFQPLAGYRGSDIVGTLNKEKRFNGFANELKKAGLTETLKQGDYFTILAPTNEAVDAVDPDTFNRFSQPENRIRVLKYHLIPGQVTEDDLKKGEVTTLEGNPVKILVTQYQDGQTIKINEANTKYPSTPVDNGVIIEIDKVLLPPGF